MKKFISMIIILISSFILGTHVLAITGTVQTNSLNVREKASTDSNSIGVLNKGKKVSIISEENEWYKIKFENGNGYIKGEYVTINEGNEITDAQKESNAIGVGNSSVEREILEYEEEGIGSESPNDSEKNSENLTSTSSSSYDSTTTENVKKLETNVDLYVLPLVNATKIGILEEGTEINIVSNNGKWLFVQSSNIRGWIISKKVDTIDPTGVEKNEEDEVIDNEIVEENTTIEEKTTQESTENKVDESSTTETNSINYPTTMYVSGDSVNIRKSASTTSEAISGASKNDTIKVIGKEGDWYKVDTEDGIGYIKSDLLSSSKK